VPENTGAKKVMDQKEEMQNRLSLIEADRELALQNTDAFKDAINNVLQCAKGDTGGSKRCAQYILSLWNGDYFKCDLQDLLYIDSEIHHQFLMIMDYLHKTNEQLYSFVDKEKIQPVIDVWGDVYSVKNKR